MQIINSLSLEVCHFAGISTCSKVFPSCLISNADPIQNPVFPSCVIPGYGFSAILVINWVPILADFGLF